MDPHPTRKRITLRDIALHLGCDKSTVSLALRNRPEVAEETRRRVHQAAAELGYVPDPALAFIASRRWDSTTHRRRDTGTTLAFVYSGQTKSYAVADYFRGACRGAERRGYQMTEFCLDDYPGTQRLEDVLVARGIQGMILAPAASTDWGQEHSYAFPRMTVICCAFGWSRPPYHSVNFDWFRAAQVCWRQLRQLGYKRIGGALFCHTPPAEDDFLRIGAFLANQALLEGGPSIPPLLTPHHDEATFVAWVRRHKPDAVIGYHAGLLQSLKASGYRVPEEVGFATLIGAKEGQVAGTDFHVESVGEQAVDLLVSTLLKHERGFNPLPQSVFIEPSFILGPTLRPTSPA